MLKIKKALYFILLSFFGFMEISSKDEEEIVLVEEQVLVDDNLKEDVDSKIASEEDEDDEDHEENEDEND
jgi:hypothetical protein